MGRIVDSEAHKRAQRRLIDADFSSFRAFTDLECGIHHQDVAEYVAATPTYQALPSDLRGRVVGLVLAFAMTAVESDREQRG